MRSFAEMIGSGVIAVGMENVDVEETVHLVGTGSSCSSAEECLKKEKMLTNAVVSKAMLISVASFFMGNLRLELGVSPL